jgi:hypothetical protein
MGVILLYAMMCSLGTQLAHPDETPPTPTPVVLEFTLEPGTSANTTASVTTPNLPPNADVLFAFDNTFSMSDILNTAKAKAMQIMANLQATGVSFRYGVVSYMDYTNRYFSCGYSNTYGRTSARDYPYRLDLPLTNQPVLVSNKINGLYIGNGEDGPQNYSRIFYETYADSAIGWRPGARRVLVNFGDNVPHDCNLNAGIPGVTGTWSTGADPGRDSIIGTADDLVLRSVLQEMRSNNVVLLEAHTENWRTPAGRLVFEYWSNWTAITGGKVFLTASSSLVNDVVREITSALVVTCISNLHVATVPSLYNTWLTPTPPSYERVCSGDTRTFNVTITVPPGTPPGDYTFLLSLQDDRGISYLERSILIHVPSRLHCHRAYTTDADFDLGTLLGVEHNTVHDQLQLSTEYTTLPFIWVPNEEDTVSKVDTRTGRELGRYRTGPSGFDGQPSRTTVDLNGNCWVANRYAGTVVKLGLAEGGAGIDRNRNGRIDTSMDSNNDGNITGIEVLPWGQDECVLFEIVVIPGKEGTYTPGQFAGGYTHDWTYPGPRSIAVDARNNVWVGTYGGQQFYYIDGLTGRILQTNDVARYNHAAYGAVIDRNGIVWSASQDRDHLLRIDASTTPPTMSVLALGHFAYGLAADSLGHVFVSGWEDSSWSRINVNAGSKDWTRNDSALFQGRGVAVTADNDVWVASSYHGWVRRYNNDGTVTKATIRGFSQPTGVAVDADGKVWVCDLATENIYRINPVSNAVDLTKRLLGSQGHYGYSDMTGIMARNVTTKIGTWTVVHDGGERDVLWGTVGWNSAIPEGASIHVEARAAEDIGTLGSRAFIVVRNGQPFCTAGIRGRFVEVRTTFTAGAAGTNGSPVLYDLSVECCGRSNAVLGNLVWRDSNRNGRFDAGEAGLDGVVLTLLSAGPDNSARTADDLTLARQTTSGGGQYQFADLAEGNYFLVISNPLSGYTLSSPVTVMADNGVDNDDNGDQPDGWGTPVFSPVINLASGETDATVDFGFYARPTAATIVGLRAAWAQGQVVIEWETASEAQTLGFVVSRRDGLNWVPVSEGLVPALHGALGGSYAVTDATVSGPSVQEYALEELEFSGATLRYGTVRVTVRPAATVAGARLEGGQAVFEFGGEAGATYDLEATDNLAGGRWENLGAVAANAAGRLVVRASGVQDRPQRFYRALKK